VHYLRFFFCLLLCTAPTVIAASQTLRVAAASDLKFAFDEIVAVFAKEEPGIFTSVAYGASGSLFAQIENGAPFDLFLSADAKYVERLIAAGRAKAASRFRFADAPLAVWVPRFVAIDLSDAAWTKLSQPIIRRLAIANPRVAPSGAAASAALQGLELYEALKPRFVFGENAGQTAQFAETGAVDAAIIPLPLALAPRLKESGRHWLLPAEHCPPMEHTGVICTDTANPQAAERLRTFLSTPKAIEIFARHGFHTPAPEKPAVK
jgi:molybdate transport system substrate-binding protein